MLVVIAQQYVNCACAFRRFLLNCKIYFRGVYVRVKFEFIRCAYVWYSPGFENNMLFPMQLTKKQ